MVSEKIVNIKSTGDKLTLKDDHIELIFPEGFIECSSISFRYSATTQDFFGPCSFPKDVRLVSAILSLHPEKNIQFLKPITISMPHFIHVENEDECKNLAYFKACLDDYKIVDGEKVINFKKVENMNVTYDCKQRQATLHATHCCFYCIAEYNITRNDTNRASFCIAYAEEKLGESIYFHYCVLYLLPSCMKVSECNVYVSVSTPN